MEGVRCLRGSRGLRARVPLSKRSYNIPSADQLCAVSHCVLLSNDLPVLRISIRIPYEQYTSCASTATNDEALHGHARTLSCGGAKFDHEDIEYAAPMLNTPRPGCHRWISCNSAWKTEKKATVEAMLINYVLAGW